MRYVYAVDITLDQDGRHLVRFPDVEGALTDGATRAEALTEAQDCLEVSLMSRMAHGEAIPEPSAARGRPTVPVELTLAAKLALYERMRAMGITNVELARRLNVSETVVRRMLNPSHKTKTESLLRALHALGVRLEVHSMTEERAA